MLLITGNVLSTASAADRHVGGTCVGKVQTLRQCRWIDGTLAVYNGTPSVRIRQHGARRTYAVGPAEDEWMPPDLKSRLTVDNAIDGRFRVCPVGEDRPRGLQVVCVDAAKVRKVVASP